jgi:hypothetical protein
MNRLETVDRNLADTLAAANESVLRSISIALVEYGLAETGLWNPRVDAAVRLLRNNTQNQEVQASVAALVGELDERQWDLQERVDAGEASPREQVRAFSQARAAAALDLAFNADPVAAAQDVAYEVLAAVDDRDAIRRVVEEHLA